MHSLRFHNNSTMATEWQTIAVVSPCDTTLYPTELNQPTVQTTQAGIKAKIPKEWLLEESVLSTKPRNVLPVFKSCGMLSSRELEITDVEDAVALLEKVHAREWSAYEVTVAFCKRAAIAHQLINCLMDIDFEGGMRRAKELDEHLASTGKIVGPLHGLPVSIKVRNLLIVQYGHVPGH